MSSLSRRSALALAFASMALPASQLDAQTQRIGTAQQVYRNTPGNEFTMVFTAKAAPNGVRITIDPDDTMPIYDRQGRFSVAPRLRFMHSINDHLPNVPGGPSAADISRIKETPAYNSADGRSVTVMFEHLVKNHGVPQAQIVQAMQRSKAIRQRELGF